MFRIAEKRQLNETLTLMKIDAPLVSAKAKAGQFVIVRADENSERIPLTVADCENGLVTIIFQIVGASTARLNAKKQGQFILDFVGPLGNPTQTENLKNACVVGGGVGVAIAFPLAKQLRASNCKVSAILGFRNKDLVFFKDEFEQVANKTYLMTDDGSVGKKGLVTKALRSLLKRKTVVDEVFVIGPVPMMKAVAELTREFNVKTVASLNPIMIDGTGMCGGCRVSVGGETKFACVDGPDFDAHLVDFDSLSTRNKTYREQENEARERQCNLFKKETL